jgi:hypothetical protein
MILDTDLPHFGWRSNTETLTHVERQEMHRLAAQIRATRERLIAILALAEELKLGTIETVLAKSDLELGFNVLVGKTKP